MKKVKDATKEDLKRKRKNIESETEENLDPHKGEPKKFNRKREKEIPKSYREKG